MVSALDTAATEIVDTGALPVEAQDIEPAAQPEAVAETGQSEPTETANVTEASSLEIDDDTLTRLYKEKGLEDRIRESERQKTEARLKREAGSKESTREAVGHIIRAMGNDPNDTVEGTTVKRAEYLYELARAHSALEIAKELPEVIFADYKVPVEYREKAVEGLEAGSKTAYVKALVDGAIASQKGSLSLKDISADAPLRKEIDALVSERLKQELKAARVESSVVADAPTPPRAGSGAPLTREKISAMSVTEINSRWDEVQAVIRG